jgi:hypothetical protein
MPAGTPVQLRLHHEELEALDRLRRKQSNPPTRSQELLKLIRAVLLDSASSHHEGEDGRALAGPADAEATRLARGNG